MRMEQAVPWLTSLLWSKAPAVRDAAARALARIGGVRSAGALLMAIQRIGPRPSLIVALARAAPDPYLGAVLGGAPLPAPHPAGAAGAGVPRPATAGPPFV